MEPNWIYFINIVIITTFMVLVWMISLLLKNSSIVDIFWGLGFVLIAWSTFVMANGPHGHALLLIILVTVWGIRLTLHIGIRNYGLGEDPRYQAFRRRWGKNYWWGSLFQVFLLQGFLCWVISLSVQAGQLSMKPAHLTWLGWLGLMVWITGFLFETIGDWQLVRFKRIQDSERKVLDTGLWTYTWHQNYFGEAVMWWGIFIIAVEDISNAWAIISPVVITFLLLKVSGVAMLERTVVKRRPEYVDYQKRTNAFIPWFPKK